MSAARRRSCAGQFVFRVLKGKEWDGSDDSRPTHLEVNCGINGQGKLGAEG